MNITKRLLTVNHTTGRGGQGVAAIVMHVVERFFAKVAKGPGDGCWLWTASLNRKGYGQFWNGRAVAAHRFAYQTLVGPIPKGLTVDHLCRNRACVNPSHMEIVSNRENVLRGFGAPAQNARKTLCLHGHPLPNDRRCRVCHNARMLKQYHGKRRGYYRKRYENAIATDREGLRARGREASRRYRERMRATA